MYFHLNSLAEHKKCWQNTHCECYLYFFFHKRPTHKMLLIRGRMIWAAMAWNIVTGPCKLPVGVWRAGEQGEFLLRLGLVERFWAKADGCCWGLSSHGAAELLLLLLLFPLCPSLSIRHVSVNFRSLAHTHTHIRGDIPPSHKHTCRDTQALTCVVAG